MVSFEKSDAREKTRVPEATWPRRGQSRGWKPNFRASGHLPMQVNLFGAGGRKCHLHPDINAEVFLGPQGRGPAGPWPLGTNSVGGHGWGIMSHHDTLDFSLIFKVTGTHRERPTEPLASPKLKGDGG